LAEAEPIIVMPGVEFTPFPLSATLWGEPVALSVMVMLALRLPVAVGENVALSAQLAPAANVLGLSGQVFVWAKSPALGPLMAILEVVSGAVPLLVSMTVCAGLVVVSN
jgi:hypothetical protein